MLHFEVDSNEKNEAVFECKSMPYRKETEWSPLTLLLKSEPAKKNDFASYLKFEAHVKCSELNFYSKL